MGLFAQLAQLNALSPCSQAATVPGEVWYRYRDHVDSDGASLRLREYAVIKHTPRGVWLNVQEFAWGGKYVEKRFVLKDTTGKRFAHPTPREALDAFIKRKRCHVSYCEARLAKAKMGLELGGRELDNIRWGELPAALDNDSDDAYIQDHQ